MNAHQTRGTEGTSGSVTGREPVYETMNTEIWIGEIENCGAEWTFAVIATEAGPIESYVYATQHAAVCARAAMFKTPGRRAVGVIVGRPDEN